MPVSRVTALLLVLVAGSAGAAELDDRTLVGKRIPFSLRSGVLDNPGDRPRVVYNRVVRPAPASWIRLRFERLELGRGSSVRITALLDGASQVLDSRSASQWRNTTAYFNGNAVRLELIAGPRSLGNIVEIGEVWVGDAPASPAEICGEDDRRPSGHPAVARLLLEANGLTFKCTASLFSESSCFVSAGHCAFNTAFDIRLTVVEFEVPLSDPVSGDLVHPDPEHQYAVVPGSVEYQLDAFCAVGDHDCPRDWSLFRVYANADPATGDCRTPFQAQGARLVIGETVPGTGDVEVIGYGRDHDQPVLNHTQQSDTGAITAVSTTSSRVFYHLDTDGGNSGGPVVWNDRIVAIHREAGCPDNAGMKVDVLDFVNALDEFCPDQAPEVACCAIERLTAVCSVSPAGGFVVRVTVDLQDSRLGGASINIDVDGTSHTLTVNGNQAAGRFPATVGQHTVSLMDPGDCLNPEVATCEFSWGSGLEIAPNSQP